MVGTQSSSPFGVIVDRGHHLPQRRRGVTHPSRAKERRRGLARERFEKSPPM
jgi:hypothetical protein